MDMDALGMKAEAQKVNSPKAPPKEPKNIKKVDILAEYAKRKSTDERLNLVVVGHVDAGKSTLMGHLLMLLGQVSQRTVQKYKKEAEDMRKGSFMFAWVLDATEEERSRGVTIDVGVSQFKTDKQSYTLLDAPGHKDFIPNMISGTSQADVAILVVDASPGEFESGFAGGGQTREHALLLKSLGITQLIVCVNKMDIVNWSNERFTEIQAQIKDFLINSNFDSNELTFVPVSGYTGDNIVKKISQKWYKGPTLVEALDNLKCPARDVSAPFALSVQDFYKGGLGPGSSGDVTVCGRISTGKVQVGDRVLALPINQLGTIKAIQIGDDDSTWAVAGDRVSISLVGLDLVQINLGTVICDPKSPVAVTDTIRAEINTLELDIPLTIGVPVVMHHLGSAESGFIQVLESLKTENGIKRNPRSLFKNQTAVVIIKLEKPICVQEHSVSRELSRFLLRRQSTSVAAGIVINLLPKSK